MTSRSTKKLERAASLGASEGILDTGDDWSRAVRAWTKKRGVDVAIDSVGKAVHLSCVKSLRRGGTLVLCGCTSGPDATTDLARVFWNQLNILGSTMGDMAEFREVVALMRSVHCIRSLTPWWPLMPPQRPMHGWNLAISLEKLWWIGGGESFAAKHDRPVYFCHGTFKAGPIDPGPPTSPHLGWTDSRVGRSCSTTIKAMSLVM